MDISRQLVIKDSAYAGKSVVYVMSRDQRVHDNHALLAAQTLATELSVSVYVLFVLKKTGVRSREHYEFMLKGLQEVFSALSTYGIPFILRNGKSLEEILRVSTQLNASSIFFDFSPLLGHRSMVKRVAKEFEGSVTVVDTHNIIPAWVLSDKKEFAAHTIRTKVHKKLETYLFSPPLLQKQTVPKLMIDSMSFDDAASYIQSIPSAGISLAFDSGEKAAKSHLDDFITDELTNYAYLRNDFSHDHQSGLSPYLHFGQISSLRVALDVFDAVKEAPLLLQKAKLAEHGTTPSIVEGMNALFEEMIVRKELSDNFCLFSDTFDSLASAPSWAQDSLTEHADDVRDFVYSKEEWENAKTHDVVWNASQIELTKTGKMHGYLRMYWAKKILEWSKSPEEALNTTMYLNDKYSIDGGDPNGYVGILWSIAGVHDRPWFERPVFGKVRYMNEAGLRRKFDVDQYIVRINAL